MIPYEISIKYMLAGYSIIMIVLAIYLVSLVMRWRKLQNDLKNLQEINKE